MLGHVPVGAGQHQPVVGGERAGAPRLGAVDHPLVADAVGPGDDAGEIRSAAGLRQQLDEHLVAAQGGRNMLALLLFGAGVEDRRRADRERRRVQDDRQLVARGIRCRTPSGRRWAGRGRRTRAGSRCPANPPSYSFFCSSRARSHGCLFAAVGFRRVVRIDRAACCPPARPGPARRTPRPIRSSRWAPTSSRS